MKANELRIGNYIKDPYNKTIRLVSVEKDASMLTPIPLTEEWLVRFGFKKLVNSCSYFITDILYLALCNNDFFIVSTEYEDEEPPFLYHPEVAHKLEIKYVHQLQNLYFSLTGEELTKQ